LQEGIVFGILHVQSRRKMMQQNAAFADSFHSFF
jgi:hypothetical protein